MTNTKSGAIDMKYWILTSLAILTIVVSADNASSRLDKNKRVRLKLQKPDIADLKFISVNNWRYVMRNNGSYMYDSPDADGDGNNAGGIFPRSDGTTIVFAGGFYFGTIKGTNKVVSEVEFATEFQPGRIINSNVSWDSLKAEDPNSVSQKVYVLDQNSSQQDWIEWPGERDQFGSPALISKAQTWAVFNDLDTSKTQEGRVSSPDPGLGIEVTLQSFAFEGARLSDAVVFRMTIRNKTHTSYAQSYLGFWMDVDLGSNAINDLCGVDTSRSLGFTYNANDEDEPLAVAIDILQGSIVDFSDISSNLRNRFEDNTRIVRFDPQISQYVSTSLPSSHIYLESTSFFGNEHVDPIDNAERYNTMAGLWPDGSPKYGSGRSDYFMYRGDPTLPGALNDPDVGKPSDAIDQRPIFSTGPFTIPADSSQDIWFAVIGAEGTDRLDAVRNLFETDDFIQDFFNSGFSGLEAPEAPKLSVSSGNGKIILTWQNNAEYSEDTFGEALTISTSNGYTANYVKQDFQGYRVYRSRTGLVGSFELLAQYDLDDTLGVVTNRTIGPNGNLQIDDVELGQNTGLRYFYVDSNVTNGQSYYYSVTAYDAQPYIAGPGSMSLGEDNTVIHAEATAALFADIDSPKFVNRDSLVVLDSAATVSGQFPNLGFITQVYRPDSDPTTIVGDTLLVTQWVDTGNFNSIQVTHAFICSLRAVHSTFYDYDDIRQKVPSPIVGQTFIDNRTLSAGTYSAQRDYTWSIKDIITSGLSIPRPAGIPISLESSVLANTQSAVPQSPPFDRGQKASVDSAVHTQGAGDGSVTVTVVDPSKVPEDNYTVRFVIVPTDSNGAPLVGASFLPSDRVVFEILNSTGIRPIQSRSDDPRTFYDVNGNGVFDGADIPLDESRFGTVINPVDALAPLSVMVDGLSLTINSEPPGIRQFICTATGGGTLTVPDMAAFAFNGSGFPTIDGGPAGDTYTALGPNAFNDRPNIPNLLTSIAAASVANGGKWAIHRRANIFSSFSYSDFLDSVFRQDNFERFGRFDYELRFTVSGGQARWIQSGNVGPVPFELWNVGSATPNDPSDDHRLIPFIYDADSINGVDTFNLGRVDHPISGGDNDAQTDGIFWMEPADRSPGQTGYNDYFFGSGAIGGEVMANVVLVNWNGGSISDVSWPANVNQLMPATGTVFRIVSTKPLSPSDVFTFSTNTVSQTISDNAIRSALNSIRVVPNPFYLTAYQQGTSFNKEIKFTRLPAVCTIRIFTVSGDLVKIIQHNSTSNNNRPGFSPYSDETAAPLETSLESWDLRNDRGKLVASGIYIAAIEAPGIGRQLVKFAVIQ
jgi:hypothetical protein